jgi:AraC family transcriptional regulator
MSVTSAQTEREYERRVNLALEYMQDHLDDAIALKEIAAAARFSPYHFHRIFRAFTGETLVAYHRRLRLNRAAWRLVHRPEPITEIAFGSGFTSSADFARAFRRQFGTSPTSYRIGGGRQPRRALQDASMPVWRRRASATASITKLPAMHLAYLRCRGLSSSFRSTEIRDAYATLYRWATDRRLLTVPVRPLGIYLDSPDILSMDECRYLACIAVSQEAIADGRIGVMWTNGGDYLTAQFRRPSPLFARCFFRTALSLYRHWIPEHGYLPSDSPVLEIYRRRGRFLDLHIPVERHVRTQ